MVRLAQQNDADAIHLIALLSWKQAYENVVPQEIQDIFLNEYYSVEAINNRMNEFEMIVVTEDGYTVGFAEYQVLEDATRLKAIYVLPSYQRQGYAKKMLQFIEESTSHTNGIVLDLENGNHYGEAFCEHLGFERLGARADSIYGYPLKRVEYKKNKIEESE